MFFCLQLVEDEEGEGGDSEEEQGENASPVARTVHTHACTHIKMDDL